MVAGGQPVILGAEAFRAALVVFRGVGFACLVFLCHQFEGRLGLFDGDVAARELCLGGHGVVPRLLDFLVERLAGGVELPASAFDCQFGLTDGVAGGEAVKDGDAERQSDGLAEIVTQLAAESGIVKTVDWYLDNLNL